ncbi:MAG: hypothetical protein D6704_06545 [Nitrospirae bacterium]|nr:MAG: hypothetical protein D6704_06545 [Nitrospirota bacterium]
MQIWSREVREWPKADEGFYAEEHFLDTSCEPVLPVTRSLSCPHLQSSMEGGRSVVRVWASAFFRVFIHEKEMD